MTKRSRQRLQRRTHAGRRGQRKPARQQTATTQPQQQMMNVLSFDRATMDPAEVVQLQRMIGNQAVMRMLGNQQAPSPPQTPLIQRNFWKRKKKKKSNSDSGPSSVEYLEMDTAHKAMKGKSNTAPTPEKKSGTKLDNAKTATSLTGQGVGLAKTMTSGLGVETKGAKYDSVYKDFLKAKGLPSNTEESDLSTKHKKELKEKQVEDGGIRVIIKDQDTRDHLGTAGDVVGTVGSGVGVAAGFIGLVKTFKDFKKETDPKKQKKLLLSMYEQGVATGVNTFNAGASAVSTVAGAVNKYNDDSTAKNVAEGAGSFTTHLTGMFSIFQTMMSAGKAVYGIYKLHWKGADLDDDAKREKRMEIATESIKAGKSLLSTVQSAMGSAKIFLELAGKGADFINALPIAGAAINIVMQFLDMGLQIIETIRYSIKIAKAKKVAARMGLMLEKELQKGAAASMEKLIYIRKMIEINMKRVKRAILPLVSAVVNFVADLISIGSSILNIIGALTTAAYGAGVAIMAGGYTLTGVSAGLKLGTAAAGPTAKLIRWGKQKGRDMAAKGKLGKVGKKMFNTKKTSDAKQQEYLDNAQHLIKMMGDLPDYKDQDSKVVAQYNEVYDYLKATGVSTKELFKNNNDPAKQVRMLIDAMKQRD